ncbi:hypothetical protein V6N11_076927 [Hibiscus sabdariffa]|uniref:Uncharacterized protein n=1 Tax=Hibiscus sabdariffa TaxID=183260 RepID=A0ABR2TBJ9_9ROSI
MADRGLISERFDALWCEPALEQPVASQLILGLPTAPGLGNAGGSGPLAVLELEWDSQHDRIFEPPISNSDMDSGNLLSTVLTYKEGDLVPVPISIAPSVMERDVEVIVAEGVTRKVRSVNDLILNTGTEEQWCTLAKARGKSYRSKHCKTH